MYNTSAESLDGSQYDVVIVGGGIMGSACAYAIASKRPSLKILLLEQFFFGHRRGSSHGSSRIIRLSYHESYYCRMMRKAFELWASAENEAQARVITHTGGIDFVKKGTKMETRLKEAMESAGVSFEELDTVEALQKKFPGFSMPAETHTCLYSKDAGVINASKACEMFQGLARSKGAHLCEDVKVEGVEFCRENGEINYVRTSKGQIMCKKIIFTAGPWNQKLLKKSFDLDLKMKPLNTTVAYWKCNDPKLYAAPHAPVFITYQDDERCLNAYGTPAIEYPGLVKFCLHSGYEQDPDKRLCVPNLEDIESKLKDMTKTFLPHADASNHVIAEACMYTNTQDENFVLDHLPGSKDVIIGAGFSGHGFKFAPLVGQILCDLALGEKPEFSLEPFSIARFMKEGS